MIKYKVDVETLTIEEVQDVIFDDIQDARDCLWDIIFAKHPEDAETFFKLPDAKPEEFMEWWEEWKWREDVGKEELKDISRFHPNKRKQIMAAKIQKSKIN